MHILEMLNDVAHFTLTKREVAHRDKTVGHPGHYRLTCQLATHATGRARRWANVPDLTYIGFSLVGQATQSICKFKCGHIECCQDQYK